MNATQVKIEKDLHMQPPPGFAPKGEEAENCKNKGEDLAEIVGCSIESVLQNGPMPKKRKITSSNCVAKSISEQILSSPSSADSLCELPRTQFCNFRVDRTQDKFKAGLVWALYCDLDGLPKYYAKIIKVETIPQFKVKIQWLEGTTSPKGLLKWLDNTMPQCHGIFSRGDYKEINDISSFSHCLEASVVEKENKVGILPKKGQVWAIYRHVSPKWSVSDLQTCKYDICHIVEGYNIYKVLILEKASGYETVFKAQTRAGREFLLEIPCREMIRFSHQIPAIPLTHEKEGNLRGCWELDPKAMPVCLFSSVSSTSSEKTSFVDQAGAKEMGSNGVGTSSNIVAAEQTPQGPFHLNSYEYTKAQCSKFGKLINSEEESTMACRSKSVGGNSSTRLADVCKEKWTEETSSQPLYKRMATTVTVGRRSCDGPSFGSDNAAAHAKNMSPGGVNTLPGNVDEEISSSPSKIFEKPKTVFCNFNHERSHEKFKTGQIWALYCELDELPKNYAQIESVESYPLFKLTVTWLKSCDPPAGIIPWVDKGMPVCCGTFKVASGEGGVFNDSISFSHQLSGVAAGNNLFTIYPRVGEVWALYSKFCSDLTCSDLKNREYYMVEVLEVVDVRWIIVSVLQSVTGFKTIFNAKEKEGLDSIAGAIPWIELYRFSHQVPALKLTEARYGNLRGCWELDPRSMPVCSYSTN